MNKTVKALIAVGSAVVAGIAGFLGGKKLSDHKEGGRRKRVEEEELERERKLRNKRGKP